MDILFPVIFLWRGQRGQPAPSGVQHLHQTRGSINLLPNWRIAHGSGVYLAYRFSGFVFTLLKSLHDWVVRGYGLGVFFDRLLFRLPAPRTHGASFSFAAAPSPCPDGEQPNKRYHYKKVEGFKGATYRHVWGRSPNFRRRYWGNRKQSAAGRYDCRFSDTQL